MAFDLAAIRADLKAGAQTLGYNAWDYEPDDPQDLPAAVVGEDMTEVRLNRLVTQVELPVTFFVSTADTKDATRKLDATQSVGTDDGLSFLDWLDSVTDGDGQAWRSIRFISARRQRVQLPGNPGPTALSLMMRVEVTA